MTRLRYISLLVLLASGVFVAAFAVRRRQQVAAIPNSAAALAGDVPDSMQLAALDIMPGKQLVAYVFGSSRCGYCQRPDTKAVLASLRDSLRRNHNGEFRTVFIVGIAVNTDLEEGLGYLRGIGLKSFDEITTGEGWQNEQVIRWIRREKAAEAAVPLVIIATRVMSARLAPLSMEYGPDSIVKVIHGHSALLDWVKAGTPLVNSAAAPPPSGSPR